MLSVALGDVRREGRGQAKSSAGRARPRGKPRRRFLMEPKPSNPSPRVTSGETEAPRGHESPRGWRRGEHQGPRPPHCPHPHLECAAFCTPRPTPRCCLVDVYEPRNPRSFTCSPGMPAPHPRTGPRPRSAPTALLSTRSCRIAAALAGALLLSGEHGTRGPGRPLRPAAFILS